MKNRINKNILEINNILNIKNNLICKIKTFIILTKIIKKAIIYLKKI